MPGMFNGKATECAEYKIKMEAHLSTLDPRGKGGEILRAAVTGDEIRSALPGRYRLLCFPFVSVSFFFFASPVAWTWRVDATILSRRGPARGDEFLS